MAGTTSDSGQGTPRQLTFSGLPVPTEEPEEDGSAEPTGLHGPSVTLETSEQWEGFPPCISLSPVLPSCLCRNQVCKCHSPHASAVTAHTHGHGTCRATVSQAAVHPLLRTTPLPYCFAEHVPIHPSKGSENCSFKRGQEAFLNGPAPATYTPPLGSLST